MPPLRASWIARTLALVLSAILFPAPDARASCGAESCPLDNSAFGGRGRRFSLEFSYHYVDQRRALVGTEIGDIARAYSSGGEVRTVSHISTTKAICSLGSKWFVSASLPVIDRMHQHVTAQGLAVPELREWQYSGLGDLTLMGSGPVWSTRSETSPFTVAIQAGIKLPTGRRQIQDIDGEAPEPHARPGTGSTDLLGGIQVIQTLPLPAPSGGTTLLFGSALYTHTGVGVDQYRMGRMFETHVGVGYPLLNRLLLLAQVSTQSDGKDRTEGDHPGTGGNHVGSVSHVAHGEEPGSVAHDDTGGTSVFAAPGFRYQISPWLAVSTYVQVPVYQRVNGTQLVAPWQLWFGTTYKLP